MSNNKINNCICYNHEFRKIFGYCKVRGEIKLKKSKYTDEKYLSWEQGIWVGAKYVNNYKEYEQRHLNTEYSIGLSYMKDDNRCYGMMIDFDDHSGTITEQDRNLFMLKMYNIIGWKKYYSEFSNKNNGVHIYVPFNRITSIKKVKQFENYIKTKFKDKQVEVKTHLCRFPNSLIYNVHDDLTLVKPFDMDIIIENINKEHKLKEITKLERLNSISTKNYTKKVLLEQFNYTNEDIKPHINNFAEEYEKSAFLYAPVYENEFIKKKYKSVNFSFGCGTRYKTTAKICSYCLRSGKSYQQFEEIVLNSHDGTSKDLNKWDNNKISAELKICWETMSNNFNKSYLYKSNLNYKPDKLISNIKMIPEKETLLVKQFSYVVEKQLLTMYTKSARQEVIKKITPIIVEEVIGSTIYQIKYQKRKRNKKSILTQKKFDMMNQGVQFSENWKNKLVDFITTELKIPKGSIDIKKAINYVIKSTIFSLHHTSCYNKMFAHAKYYKFNSCNLVHNYKTLIKIIIKYVNKYKITLSNKVKEKIDINKFIIDKVFQNGLLINDRFSNLNMRGSP